MMEDLDRDEDEDGKPNTEEENEMKSCIQCDKIFSSLNEMMKHIKSNHVEVKCNDCNKSFAEFKDLRRHIRKVHYTAGVVCQTCGKSFKHRDLQTWHWNFVHKVEPDMFCNLCGFECQNSHKLKRHMRVCLSVDQIAVAKKRAKNEALNGCKYQTFTCPISMLPSILERNKELLKLYNDMAEQLRENKKAGKKRNALDTVVKPKRKYTKRVKENGASEVKEEPKFEEDILQDMKHEAEELIESDDGGSLDLDGDIGDLSFNQEDEMNTFLPHIDVKVKLETESDQENDFEYFGGIKAITELEERKEEVFEEEEEIYEDDTDDRNDPSFSLQFECIPCGKTFKKEKFLKTHEKNFHTIDKDGVNELNKNVKKSRECNICGKFYKNLPVHMKGVHEIEEVACSFCGKRCKSKNHLNSHVRHKHTENPGTVCPVCAKTVKDLRSHLRIAHAEQKSCKICGKEVKNLQSHIKYVHADNKYQPCPYCGLEIRNLDMHIANVHTEAESTETRCLECNKVFESAKHFRKHVNNVHRPKFTSPEKLPCPECGMLFKKQNLNRHILHVHTENQNPHAERCDKCNKTFGSLRKLKAHYQASHTIEVTTCEECGKEFQNKYLWRYHKKRAHAPIDYKPCPHCGQMFDTKPKLYQHVRFVHTEGKCRLCDTVFKNKRLLTEHNKVHHREMYEASKGWTNGLALMSA